jgi:hypothetical protein
MRSEQHGQRVLESHLLNDCDHEANPANLLVAQLKNRYFDVAHQNFSAVSGMGRSLLVAEWPTETLAAEIKLEVEAGHLHCLRGL